MVTALIIKMYECNVCEGRYSDEEEAEKCESKSIKDELNGLKTLSEGNKTVYVRSFEANYFGREKIRKVFLVPIRRHIDSKDHKVDFYVCNIWAYCENPLNETEADIFQRNEVKRYLSPSDLKKLLSEEEIKKKDMPWQFINLDYKSVSNGVFEIDGKILEKLTENDLKFKGLLTILQNTEEQ